MRDLQIVYGYAENRKDLRPVVTTALKLDVDQDKKIVGISVGMAYCSDKDMPNKKIGKKIATTRAESFLKDKHHVVSNGRLYGAYISVPMDIPSMDVVFNHLKDSPCREGVILAITNVVKFNQL